MPQCWQCGEPLDPPFYVEGQLQYPGMLCDRCKEPEEDIEEWWPIPGSPRYEASTLGNIRHKKYQRILKGGLPYNGYRQVDIVINGKRITKCVHQLIALTFLGPRPEGHEVHHKDYNPKNNRLDNLQYIPFEKNHRKHPEKFCSVCGKSINIYHETCSKKCFHLSRIRTVTCSVCGKAFDRYLSQVRAGERRNRYRGKLIFCSNQCKGSWLGTNYGNQRTKRLAA